MKNGPSCTIPPPTFMTNTRETMRTASMILMGISIFVRRKIKIKKTSSFRPLSRDNGGSFRNSPVVLVRLKKRFSSHLTDSRGKCVQLECLINYSDNQLLMQKENKLSCCLSFQKSNCLSSFAIWLSKSQQ